MARKPRPHLAGVPLHIVQRGHNRANCFSCELDFRAYRHYLAMALEETGCQLHAYVLMSNHVHMLITPPAKDSAADLMMALGRRFVPFINRTYSRTGTLWESRYHSSIIETETYLINCQRYIELNPVRACMVGNPADYAWSSHACNAFGDEDMLVTPHALFNDLCSDAEDGLSAYRALFNKPLPQNTVDQFRDAIKRGMPLGPEAFVARVCNEIGIVYPPRPRGRPCS